MMNLITGSKKTLEDITIIKFKAVLLKESVFIWSRHNKMYYSNETETWYPQSDSSVKSY